MAVSPSLSNLPDLKSHYRQVPYTFVNHFEAYLQELICPICKEIVEEPLLTSCGHIFCEKCHRESNRPVSYGRRTSTPITYAQCPVCRQKHTTMKDNFNDRRAKSLQVRCRNHEGGCQWVGALADEVGHREKTNGCEFEPISCPRQGCSASMRRQDLAQHANMECLFRPYQCEYCDLEGTYSSITGSHYQECMRYPVTCPNDCTIETICRAEVKKHMDEDCPLQRVACRYKRIGCTEQVRRQNLERHLEEEKDRHLQLAMDSVVELTLKVDEMAIKVEELTAKSKENGLQPPDDMCEPPPVSYYSDEDIPVSEELPFY